MLALIALAATSLVAARPASETGRRRTRLSDSDRRLARLGAALATAAPSTARRLARHVERRLGAAAEGVGTFAPCARRLFLRPDRLRREFVRGQVVLVDGWVLARSEAAVCAYLDRLARGEQPTV